MKIFSVNSGILTFCVAADVVRIQNNRLVFQINRDWIEHTEELKDFGGYFADITTVAVFDKWDSYFVEDIDDEGL